MTEMFTANDGLLWSWGALLMLGAFHGINPGMGWLFAVALGMQEGRGRAVWRALGPLAAGHAAAIAAVVAAALVVGVVVPQKPLQWSVALLLVSTGAYRLVRHRHPRWGGMRVGARDLTIWSFLMASAHGAGLMVLPFMPGLNGSGAVAAHAAHAAHGAHAAHPPAAAGAMSAVTATVVHGAGYLIVTAFVAWIVYRRVGVGMLRRAWVNLDLVWALALIATGVIGLLI